jgi:hypothetical protein
MFIDIRGILSPISFSAFFLNHAELSAGFHKLIVLRTHNNGIDAKGFSLFIIFNRYLGFAIGSQVFHLFSLSPYCSKFLQQNVGKLRRQRHKVIHFAGCISEHHSLIASSLIFFF